MPIQDAILTQILAQLETLSVQQQYLQAKVLFFPFDPVDYIIQGRLTHFL